MQMIDAPTLKRWLDWKEAVLVDVREPAEFASGHLAGAVSVPLSRLSAGGLPEHAGKKLVMQCKAGRRAESACTKLSGEVMDMLYNLEGGIDAWIAAGFEVEQTATRKVLPMEQQLRVTVGVLLLIGLLLGYGVHPAFFLLSGLLGGGLIYSGLTGACGMAMVLARMPWNRMTG